MWGRGGVGVNLGLDPSVTGGTFTGSLSVPEPGGWDLSQDPEPSLVPHSVRGPGPSRGL